MNSKTLIISTIIGLLTFGLGWFLSHTYHIGKGSIADAKHDDNAVKVAAPNNSTKPFSERLLGRFVIKGANCAGFNFISPTKASWTNEIQCNYPDTLKLHWLDDSTFFTQDIKRLRKGCPPRVWIHRVQSFDGEHLVLTDIWTGWNEHPDAQLELEKQTGY